MSKRFVELVYYTLLGQLVKEYRIPGVINAFAPGSVCEQCYSQMYDAYERVRNRLGVIDEDEDVEIIIQSLMQIGTEIAYHMYHYGAIFGECDEE